MSAWYIFSAMGFYPVAPGDLSYAIGAPQLPKISLNLPNKQIFTVEAKNLSDTHKYIQTATLNGKPLTNSYISHQQIMAGGKLSFVMSDKPNKEWGLSAVNRPPSMSTAL